MAGDSALLVEAIENSTFPDSETLLSSQIDTRSLLTDLSKARTQLQDEIRQVSRAQSGDVDTWIQQAKKVQADIARCKEEARQIVEEYEKVEALRKERADMAAKVSLLETEMRFNMDLESQMQQVKTINLELKKVQSQMSNEGVYDAARALGTLRPRIVGVRAASTRNLLQNIHVSLASQLESQLLDNIRKLVHAETTTDQVILHLSKEINGTSLERSLSALSELDRLEDAADLIVDTVNHCLIPYRHKRSSRKISAAEMSNNELHLTLSNTSSGAVSQVRALQQTVAFIADHTPEVARSHVLSKAIAPILNQLPATLLDDAIPADLESLTQITSLYNAVGDLAATARGSGIETAQRLESWLQDIPNIWLRRFEVTSLDHARRILRQTTTTTKRVERLEQQVLTPEPLTEPTEDDWSAWDKEDEDTSREQVMTSTIPSATSEDEPDAWGFDDDEKVEEVVAPNPVEEDDADAWGWNDENDETTSKPSSPVQTRMNGIPLKKSVPAAQSQPQVYELREQYTITSIPDQILSIIQNIHATSSDLTSNPSRYFPNHSLTSKTLKSLDTVAPQVLTLFRAIAPHSYPITPLNLTPMHLYNDALYLSTSTLLIPPLQTTLDSFATQIYTTELTLHKRIITDLLDSTKGFTSYQNDSHQTMTSAAINSATSYLSQLHASWSPILGPSHLHQAIGSLLTMIISTVTISILDLDDISEPESRRLNEICTQISTLSTLFPPLNNHQSSTATDSGTNTSESDSDKMSSISLFVPNYIRLQYLMQVLTGNLRDIEYLWVEAGLNLEFTGDEVVDLIKALFEESPRRRETIGVIRR